jgi:hypothetical protein
MSVAEKAQATKIGGGERIDILVQYYEYDAFLLI